MANGSASARLKARDGEAHHEGFDRALDSALAKLSKKVGTGKYPVTVEFAAEVEVTNPGIIGWYKVRLTTP